MVDYRIESLSKAHDRTRFDCGVPALNEYLANRAGQDSRRRFASCSIAVAKATGEVAGYYTLSAGSLALEDLPDDMRRHLPRYSAVPIGRIGRLAVDLRHQHKRLGRGLLGHALETILQCRIAIFAAVVDAKDDSAALYYERFGFQRLHASPLSLFLPISDAVRQLAHP